MKCLGCDYSLEGLTAGACPECSRAFDPADPTTIGPRPPRRWVVWLLRLSPIAASWPAVLVAGLYVMYFTARLVLGRWPILTGADDPKYIPVVGVMHTLWGVALTLSPLMLLLGAYGLAVMTRRKPMLGMVVAAVVIALWLIAGACVNIVDVLGWYID